MVKPSVYFGDLSVGAAFENAYPFVRGSCLGNFEDLELEPAVNMIDTGQTVCLEFEIPGVSDRDLHISIDDGVLILTAKRSVVPSRQEVRRWLLREIGEGAFERRVTLPSSVIGAAIHTECRHGMLYVHLSKSTHLDSKGLPSVFEST